MPLAHSPAPDTGILVLTFLCGFALATLVFWPLLHRMQQAGGPERGSGRSRSEGRHALNRRTEAKSAPVSAKDSVHPAAPAAEPVAVAVPAPRPVGSQEPDSTTSGPSEVGLPPAGPSISGPSDPDPQAADTAGTGPEAAALPAVDPDEGTASSSEDTPDPAQRSEEPYDPPSLPSDLFQQHHAAHFQRARQRVARIRLSMNGDPAR